MEANKKNLGALSWHELTTASPNMAMHFYAQIFNWEFTTVNLPHGDYHLIQHQGKSIGGITPNLQPEQAAFWTGYITVDDVDLVAIKVKQLGGELVFGPEDIDNIGRFCWIKDPQGAMIAAISYL